MAERKHPDVWVDPENDPREGGPRLADERTTLVEYLRFQRLTLQMKCDDLDAEQMAGLDAPRLYSSAPGEDGDWNGAVADPEVVADAWARWQEEYARHNGHADLLRERIDGRTGQ